MVSGKSRMIHPLFVPLCLQQTWNAFENAGLQDCFHFIRLKSQPPSISVSIYTFGLRGNESHSFIIHCVKSFQLCLHPQAKTILDTDKPMVVFFSPSEKATWPARLPQQAFAFSIGLFSFHHLDGTCDQLSLPSLKTLNLLIICPPYCYIFRANRLLQNLLQMYTGFLATEQQSWTELFCEAAK